MKNQPSLIESSPIHSHEKGLCRVLRAGLVLAIMLLTSTGALADDFIDQVNAFYADIRVDQRSDPIILAALAEMDAPPEAVDTPSKAAMLPPSAGAWSTVREWALLPQQVAVLDALGHVTEKAGTKRAMAFGQPYGIAALGSSPAQIKFIQAGLYTDLGDPPMLAAAQHLYLDRFDDIACLVHVHATSLLDDGDAQGALAVLINWLAFARQIADREFFAEKMWAFDTMTDAALRIRDVAYTDFRGSATLTPDQIKTQIDRLLDYRGPIASDRIQLGRGDFLAVEQLIATVFGPDGTVQADVFAPTMARLASTSRPLRLFGEAARWNTTAQTHADREGTLEAFKAMRDDYTFRWARDRYDPLLDQPYAVERYFSSSLVRNAVATVTRSLPDMRALFDARLIFRMELVGTRQALALVGFHKENRTYPLDITGVRPRFLVKLATDPFNPNRSAGQQPPLQFFVPIRDTKDRFASGDAVMPHEMTILTSGTENILIRLDEKQFVLFSVGSDGSSQWADVVQNTIDAPPGRDYLIWPPTLSILRETLLQSGKLK